MNVPKISAICPFGQLSEYNAKNGVSSRSFGLKMSSPLSADTVSFGSKYSAGKKAARAIKELAEDAGKDVKKVRSKTVVTNEDRTEGARFNVAKDVHDIAKARHWKIVKFVDDIFKDLKATDKNPSKPILKIGDRVKSEDSIKGKSNARHWKDKDTILDKMEDLNGMKIVLNYGATKNDVDRILDRLIPYINSGELQLLEAENKRAWCYKALAESERCKYDYGSLSKIEELIEAQIDKWSNLKKDKYSDMKNRLKKCGGKALTEDCKEGNNYMAMHFIFRIPKYDVKFELQIMGPEVNRVKRVDDVVWKYLDGKNADKKYASTVGSTIKSLLREDNVNAKNEFNRYRGDWFICARDNERMLETNKSAKRKVEAEEIALDFSNYKLTPEYSYKRLSEDITNCDMICKEVEKLCEGLDKYHYKNG